MTASRAQINAALCAVELSIKVTSVIHRRGWSTATLGASSEGHTWRCLPSMAALGKCHEMRKSRLQSRYWARLPSTRLVQQAAVLFEELPRCLPSWSVETVATRVARHDLLRVAFLATDWEATAEVDASTCSDTGALKRQQGRVHRDGHRPICADQADSPAYHMKWRAQHECSEPTACGVVRWLRQHGPRGAVSNIAHGTEDFRSFQGRLRP